MELANGLDRIAEELARIEREYRGAVNLVVVRDAGFQSLVKVNVRIHLRLGG